ncbi:transcriptional regulator [Rhizobium sp. TRM95111]|uniref:winged helix-turn-helix domain-containing protein n=1 Tax=Rhizobium alarense TaxID=2846851 RepID=UPI001F46345E|nr:transcriptional regulator [Rhizobium alarense]MCF3640647.1 transcriptional regulator [Rhizobium alarense]
MNRRKAWPSLRFDFVTGARLGPGKVDLMERVQAVGSIRAAGAAMGMSYRRAWLLADEINRMFTTPVIAAKHGGKAGGGATLTPFGAEVLIRYRAMEARARDVYAEELAWLGANMDGGFEGKAPKAAPGDTDD